MRDILGNATARLRVQRDVQSVVSGLSSSRWGVLRPFLYALALLLVVDSLMMAGDRYLAAYAFPWATVSLLVIAAVANLWGVRPALMVLLLACLFGDLIAPGQHISLISPHFSWKVRLTRTLLFSICGSALILVAWQSRLMRERAAQRQLVVQALQRMVLPDTLPRITGCDLASLYRPARSEEEVGGDFYDVFPIKHTHNLYGILFGDVVGKGKEAAEHTAVLRYTTRAYLGLGLGPAECLARLNELLDAQKSALGSASLFLGVLDAETGRLCYANAGHEPPLLTRGTERGDSLAATGMLVGVLADAPYEEAEIEIAPGDSLLLVTDGVTEARDSTGRFLDEDGVWDLLRPSLRAGMASAVVTAFAARLDHFTDGVQRDDIAILFLRRPKPLRLAKAWRSGVSAASGR
jgi:serine phosphatase RsbU (regulator of sigma subunit)